MFVCAVLLSQPSSRDNDYPLWDAHVSRIKRCLKKKKGCVK